jgi:hypothetical protein
MKYTGTITTCQHEKKALRELPKLISVRIIPMIGTFLGTLDDS